MYKAKVTEKNKKLAEQNYLAGDTNIYPVSSGKDGASPHLGRQEVDFSKSAIITYEEMMEMEV